MTTPDSIPDSPQSYRSFLISFAATSAVLLTGMAGLNVAIDPYTTWGSRLFPGVYVVATTRVGKGEVLHRYTGDTVLVGNSRVMLGIRDQGADGGASAACNLGVSGASYGELQEILRQSLAKPSLRRILLFVDYHTFRDEHEFRESFAMSRFNPHKNGFDHLCDLLLNYHASEDSFQKIGEILKGTPPQYTSTACPIPEVMTAKQPLPDRSERILRVIAGSNQSGFHYSAAAVEQLRPLMAQCLERDVELTFVINPLHATVLESIWRSGLQPDYENWMRHLTRVVEEESKGRITLWDFSGFHRYTTEPLIQPDGTASTELAWFWEPSHYTVALGDRMMARILGAKGADPDFGIKLTTSCLDERLRSLSRGHDGWAAAHRAEVDVVRQISETGAADWAVAAATQVPAATRVAEESSETVVR